MTMTRDQIIDLLSIIVSYDNRAADEPAVIAWSAVAQSARWTWAEARDAVVAHYTSRTDWLMPAHVTTHIRARRRDQIERAAVPAQCSDPGLLRRIEAIADAKAVDRATGPAPLPAQRDSHRGPDAAQRTIEAAMHAGQQARAHHQLQLEAGAS